MHPPDWPFFGHSEDRKQFVYLRVAPGSVTGYPLKLHFQIPCVFPVRLQIFPLTIYVICDIHKTELADLSSFKKKIVASQSGALFKLVGGYWLVHPTYQKYLVVDVFSKDSSPRGTGPFSSFRKKMEIFAANIEISFTFRIREFTT